MLEALVAELKAQGYESLVRVAVGTADQGIDYDFESRSILLFSRNPFRSIASLVRLARCDLVVVIGSYRDVTSSTDA